METIEVEGCIYQGLLQGIIKLSTRLYGNYKVEYQLCCGIA